MLVWGGGDGQLNHSSAVFNVDKYEWRVLEVCFVVFHNKCFCLLICLFFFSKLLNEEFISCEMCAYLRCCWR